MRVYIGGVAQLVPARWYWAPDGAQLLPSPHGCESSFWLDNREINYDWGEATPLPRDPAAGYWLTWDNGDNPGYLGQCHVGDDQWFVDGQLDADILDSPPQPLPGCCAPALPPTTWGGPVLAGGGVVPRQPPVGTGAIVLAGQARPGPQPWPGRGAILLAGGAAPPPGRGAILLAGGGTPQRALSAILLGGGASTQPQPGTDCCTGGLLQAQHLYTLGPALGGKEYWWTMQLQAGVTYAIGFLPLSLFFDYGVTVFDARDCHAFQLPVLAGESPGSGRGRWLQPYTGPVCIRVLIAWKPNPVNPYYDFSIDVS